MRHTKKVLSAALFMACLFLSFNVSNASPSVSKFKLAKDTAGKYHRLVENNKKITGRISSLSSFMQANKKKKRKTMFVLIPPSVKKGTTKFPKGVTDYSNEMSNKMLKGLQGKKLDTYDLRVPFVNYANNSLYYKRDHHWNQKAAFDASNFIITELNRKYEISAPDIDKFSSVKNYNTTTYKKVFQGSFSTLYGKTKPLKEDFSIFTPKWKTNFTLKGYDNKGKLKKTFSDKNFMNTFINKKNFNAKIAKYTCFLNGYTVESVVTNKDADNDLKVLVLSTSLARPVIPYISNYFKEVHFIDTLKTNINVTKYADTIKPDIVLVLYSASSFANDACFIFNR